MSGETVYQIAPAQQPDRPSPRIKDRAIDLLIRLAGLCGIALSIAALHALHRHMQDANGQASPALDYLLATFGFLLASVGSGLVILGHHLNDRIELSERWRPRI